MKPVTKKKSAHAATNPPSDFAGAGTLLLMAACLSWGALMAPLISAGPLALDEHVSCWMIDSELPASTLHKSLDYGAVPPLSNWLDEAVVTMLGRSPLTLRLSSALAMLGAILATYRAGRHLKDATTGGLAALLLAWHPAAMDEVRIARCYGLVMLCAALLLWASLCWRSRPTSRTAALGWLLAASALLWTHYTAAPLVLITALVTGGACWKSSHPGVAIASWGLVQLIAIGVCLPLVPSVLRLQEWGAVLNYSAAVQPVWRIIGPLWWAGLPAACLFLSLLGKRPANGPRLSNSDWGFLLACSLLPLLCFALLAQGELSSLGNPRYLVAYAPAGVCFIAALATRLTRVPAIAAIGIVLALAIAWGINRKSPFVPGRLGDPADRDWSIIAEQLRRNAIAGSPIFVQSGLVESYLVPLYVNDPLFLEYVACRISKCAVPERHPRIGLPFLWQAETGVVDAYQAKVRQLAENDSTDFWIAAATDTDLNRNSLLGMQQIAENAGYTMDAVLKLPRASLMHYVSADLETLESRPVLPSRPPGTTPPSE